MHTCAHIFIPSSPSPTDSSPVLSVRPRHLPLSLSQGASWVTARWLAILMGTIVAAIMGVNCFTLVTLVEEIPEPRGGAYIGFGFLIAGYIALVGYFALGPSQWPGYIRRLRSAAQGMWRSRRASGIESMLEVHY